MSLVHLNKAKSHIVKELIAILYRYDIPLNKLVSLETMVNSASHSIEIVCSDVNTKSREYIVVNSLGELNIIVRSECSNGAVDYTTTVNKAVDKSAYSELVNFCDKYNDDVKEWDVVEDNVQNIERDNILSLSKMAIILVVTILTLTTVNVFRNNNEN